MDLEAFFERLSSHYAQQLPFVVYRKPNQSVVKAILQKSSKLNTTTNYTEKGFVFAPFDDTQETVLIPTDDSELIEVYYDIPNGAESQPFKNDAVSKEKKLYMQLVEKAIKTIKKGELQKVVLSRKETLGNFEKTPFKIFQNLLNTYLSAFVYLWYHPKVGLWIGATPETLINIQGNRLSIMALAGTQVYPGSLDVKWKSKELKEQQLVTDFIINQLNPFADSIEASNAHTVKAGNLVHLKTMISVKLKSLSNLSDILSAIHPTPAVCGLPKEDAKKFILENESYQREFYSGFLGEINFTEIIRPRSSKKNIENRAYQFLKSCTGLYVNLRCAKIENNRIHIYVGGGITEQSNAGEEWQETASKSLTIKSML